MTRSTTTIAPDRKEIKIASAVPTFLVSDVGSAARWYKVLWSPRSRCR
jgi:hypothetical protein